MTVRNRQWVATEVSRSSVVADDPTRGFDATPQHLVTLVSIEDDAGDEELRVVWELEQQAVTHDRHALPSPQPVGDESVPRFDDPDRLDAFLDAVRWGAIASADKTALQAPFRSGIKVEDYQLDPVVRALSMPRTNLLIADDVGLGKTIEAGLVMQELMLRHRARTMLIVCPANLTVQWRDEMRDKFGLDFKIVNSELLRELRRSRGLYTNPWTHYPRLIVSVDWLKRERPMRLLRDVLPAVPEYPRAFDLLVVDEIHTCAPSGNGKYAVDSQRTTAIRTLAPHCEHRLFLSATPHNGYLESFTALLELLDDQRFARGVPPSQEQLARIMVRRLKRELPPNWDGTARFPKRELRALEVEYSAQTRDAYADLTAYAAPGSDTFRRRHLRKVFPVSEAESRTHYSLDRAGGQVQFGTTAGELTDEALKVACEITFDLEGRAPRALADLGVSGLPVSPSAEHFLLNLCGDHLSRTAEVLADLVDPCTRVEEAAGIVRPQSPLASSSHAPRATSTTSHGPTSSTEA